MSSQRSSAAFAMAAGIWALGGWSMWHCGWRAGARSSKESDSRIAVAESAPQRPVATVASSNPFHRVDPRMHIAGKAKVEGKVFAMCRHKPKSTHVLRVALTGGPCAGKSSALAHLTARATAEGFDVYAAPETATVLFNSGVQLPSSREGRFVFQTAILKQQLATERNLTSIAAATGRPSIIIFDRGALDAKGYMDQEMWLRVLAEGDSADSDGGRKTQGVSEDYLLRRYDGVLHLVTAAEGAEQFYQWGHVKDDSGGDVFRRESPAEAVALDHKMRQCWAQHSKQFIIGNENGFAQKLTAVADALMALAHDSHPQEYQRAAAAVAAATVAANCSNPL